MTYFSQIDPANTRRFTLVDADFPVVLAIYDQSRSYTLYAEVGTEAAGNVCFVSAPRSYFSDEVEEYH